MTSTSPFVDHNAREKYLRSLMRARISDLFGLITGENTDLVRYDEVAKRLKARQKIEQGVQVVLLDKIVGSVGRYRDFTRTFLPRPGIKQWRWAKIDSIMNSQEGWPPVELYKIGDVYFVRDGNHRISVARANGLSDVEAYVTEVETPVQLNVDDFDHDRWIIKAEYADFLEKTKLDALRPEMQLEITEPGRYNSLLRHIEVHRYLQNLEREREFAPALSWDEGVMSWYDTVYMPIVDAIRCCGILASFPNRTEADLYLWITHHREALADQYEMAPLSADQAVTTFASTHSERPFESLWQRVRWWFRRKLWTDSIPAGMSMNDFHNARARHIAGDLSLGEVQRLEAEASS